MSFLNRVKILSGISDTLYHFTSVYNAFKILHDNRFQLTVISGSDDVKPNSKFYYLSTTRSRVGSYHVDRYSGALLKLDGKKLRQNYTGNPVDYWGREFRKVAPSKNEMEDRIWSDKPFIVPADKYIEEIHVYHREHVQEEEATKKLLKMLILEADQKNIPIFVYTTKEAALTLDKRKATPVIDLGLEGLDSFDLKERGKRDDMEVWLELYEKNDKNDLSSDPFGGAQRYLRNLYSFDNYSTFKADLHNSKGGTPSLHKIVEIIKKRKWKFKDFYDFLREKWKH